jgi:hypothetical protein
MGNPVYGECAKHRGQSMINCPICDMENMSNKKVVFDILKQDRIVLPPCDSANGKETRIDTLKKKQYVFVTYDPLYERVVCVHEKLQSECDKCKRLRKARDKKGCYHLETSKFLIRP